MGESTMYDIKNLNIWKTEYAAEDIARCGKALLAGPDGTAEFIKCKAFLSTDIADLNLEVRASNCLRRSGCRTVGDIFRIAGDEGGGIMKIRGLGRNTMAEIIEKLREKQKEVLAGSLKERRPNPPSFEQTAFIKRSSSDKMHIRIDEVNLSNYARTRLEACGIAIVKDLYATNPKREPGWYAVRELFEKI